MVYNIDPRTGELLWHCPKCGESIHFPNLQALHLAEQAGGCQGCRAKATFEHNPELIGLFLDFWVRTDAWPKSSSWIEAIHVPVITWTLKRDLEEELFVHRGK
jgi:hypothetical protein